MRRCVRCNHDFEANAWRCPRCGFEPPFDGYRHCAPELSVEFEGYDPDYYADLVESEASSFWFQSRNRLIVWAIRKYFGDIGSFLEIGCGTGFVLTEVRRAFPTAKLTATEVLVKSFVHARARAPDVELLQMDARRLAFTGAFDAIGAFDVIEHIEEDEAVLAEIHRALHTGGGFLLTVPQHSWLWSAADDEAHHKRRYRRSDLVAKMEKAGFEVVRATSFVSLLLPVMYLRLRSAGTSRDPIADHRLSRWLNAVLSAVMWVEGVLIRAGIDLPAGGSLLVIARKPK